MKKKLVLKIIIILATIGVIYEGYGMIKELTRRNKIEEIETQKILESNDKSIAILVQDTNNPDKWEEYEDRSKWPDPSTHGFVGAECTDSEGHDIDWEKVLTFSLVNKTATIKTKQTSYCTLYFATGEPALDHLKKKGGSTFNSTSAVDGMYRFKGSTVTTNYICFGTTVESTCTGNASGNYMYRIIGITSAEDKTIGLYANQLKIIRTLPSSTSIAWGSGSQTWGSSSAKTYLNGTFLDTIKVLPDGSYWDSMISQHGWYITDQTSTPGTTEPKTTTLAGDANNRIGLMYATDYINANSNNSNNWLYIKNGWNESSYIEEWTMTRYGQTNSSYYAWRIDGNGALSKGWDVTNSRAVRPVFYLRPGVNLTGEGTKDHPYIITSLPNN